VVYRCEGNIRPDLVIEILEHASIEVFSVVECDLLWNSVIADDVLPEFYCVAVEDTLVAGFVSIHLMKYSTATMAKV
jgi:hypothetical protein